MHLIVTTWTVLLAEGSKIQPHTGLNIQIWSQTPNYLKIYTKNTLYIFPYLKELITLKWTSIHH